MSLRQYVDTIERRLYLNREENYDRRDISGSRGRRVIEEKAESENGQAADRIKDSLSENSEEKFELSEPGSELVRTRCSKQDEAMRNFQNKIDSL